MREDDYVFTPLTGRAGRLPNVQTPFDCNRPLSAKEVGRLMKRYARLAGLDADRIHVHLLRHSAAMLMDAVGARERDIQQFLHHSNLDTTSRYLHALRGERNDWWQKVDTLLNL
jgi:site-specific recombinase XerD